MPQSGAHLPYASSCGPCEAWRFGWMVTELWWTSAFGMLSRSGMLSAFPEPDAKHRSTYREWQCLWSERTLSGMEVGLEMQRSGYDLLFGRCDPLEVGQRIWGPLSAARSRRRNRADDLLPESLLETD